MLKIYPVLKIYQVRVGNSKIKISNPSTHLTGRQRLLAMFPVELMKILLIFQSPALRMSKVQLKTSSERSLYYKKKLQRNN